MAEEFTSPPVEPVGEMHKRRETMADSRRYIIYYTFGGDEKAGAPEPEKEVNTDV